MSNKNRRAGGPKTACLYCFFVLGFFVQNLWPISAYLFVYYGWFLVAKRVVLGGKLIPKTLCFNELQGQKFFISFVSSIRYNHTGVKLTPRPVMTFFF